VADIEVELIYSNFSALGDQMVRDADRQCETTANRVLTRARILIQSGPKTGKVYKHGNVLHQASAPGEAPASDTGALASNSKAERESLAHWLVIFFQEYARKLEFGTPVQLAARPFLRPAIESERRAFVAAMRKIVGDT
jgi:hypothetical protein